MFKNLTNLTNVNHMGNNSNIHEMQWQLSIVEINYIYRIYYNMIIMAIIVFTKDVAIIFTLV